MFISKGHLCVCAGKERRHRSRFLYYRMLIPLKWYNLMVLFALKVILYGVVFFLILSKAIINVGGWFNSS